MAAAADEAKECKIAQVSQMALLFIIARLPPRLRREAARESRMSLAQTGKGCHSFRSMQPYMFSCGICA